MINTQNSESRPHSPKPALSPEYTAHGHGAATGNPAIKVTGAHALIRALEALARVSNDHGVGGRFPLFS